jgi:hypothetical protein
VEVRYLKLLKGDFGDGRLGIKCIRLINAQGECVSCESAAAGHFDDQLYSCSETALYNRLLPNKLLVLKLHLRKGV